MTTNNQEFDDETMCDYLETDEGFVSKTVGELKQMGEWKENNNMETITDNTTNIQYKVIDGTAYHMETSDRVIRILENARKTRTKIRVFYGNRHTGIDWMEENDVMGTVGRSTGSIKIPLLIRTSRSMGGGAMLDDCIVKITIDKKVVYQHETYQLADLSIEDVTREELKQDGYTTSVIAELKESKVIAHFKTRKQAENYIEFLKGNRNRL